MAWKAPSLVLILCVFGTTAALENDVIMDLADYEPGTTRTAQYLYATLTDVETRITLLNIRNSVSFIILQTHALVENLTLSYTPAISLHSNVNGTNVGLFWDRSLSNGSDGTYATFFLFKRSKSKGNVTVLIAASVYDTEDPVPGGCNLSFETMIAPYQKVRYDEATITVANQPSSVYGVTCDKDEVKIETYHMFLREYDNSPSTYFNAILRTMSARDIRRFGKKVPHGAYSTYKRSYNLYRGTGEVFAAVAIYGNRSSAYVPAVSFGCDLNNWDEECVGPGMDTHWKVVCAFLLIFGAFLCFWGHRYFRLALFLIGYSFGVLLTYAILIADGNITAEGKGIFSLVMGVFYGVVWVFIWWRFGIPLLSAYLSFLLAASVLASAFFYTGFVDFYVFNNNIAFWTIYGSTVVGILIVWTIFTYLDHILALSVLGSYCVVVALSFYFGGNMQYLVINIYRRMAVKDFNKAVIDPPFQSLDIAQAVLWILMAVLGSYVQWRNQRGKPPYPPHRQRAQQPRSSTERTPLLIPEQPAVYRYT